MNYYPHHIGDFDKATRHLSRLERSIYRDLIELYYDTEEMLPLDISLLCRKIIARSNDEVTAVEQVLNEFFTKTSTGWYHDRCEEEIDKYHTVNGQKSVAGRASAAKRAEKRQRLSNGVSTGVEQPSNGTSTNQEPVTSNQEPESNSEPAVPVGGSPESNVRQIRPRIPDCPHQEIVDLYHEILPAWPRVKVLTDARKKQLRARWRENPKHQSLEFWRRLFEYAAESDFLMGRTARANGHENWTASLDFLITQAKFVNLIEGKYHRG